MQTMAGCSSPADSVSINTRELVPFDSPLFTGGLAMMVAGLPSTPEGQPAGKRCFQHFVFQVRTMTRAQAATTAARKAAAPETAQLATTKPGTPQHQQQCKGCTQHGMPACAGVLACGSPVPTCVHPIPPQGRFKRAVRAADLWTGHEWWFPATSTPSR
jgi:hypothetical protein